MMPKETTRLSDMREQHWTESVSIAVLAILLVLVICIVMWLLGLFVAPDLLGPARIGTGIALTIVGVLGIYAVYRAKQAITGKGVGFDCPFCQKSISFVAKPENDFECEYCFRTVHFLNGKHIPVQDVSCPTCKKGHKIAANVAYYLCDSCNRSIEMKVPEAYRTVEVTAPTALQGRDALLQNFDVHLTHMDPRKENDLAFKLQDMLTVPLKEAKTMLHNASPEMPLVIGYSMPQRKAEAIRQQLQALGATVRLSLSKE